jgi:uncharacterized protein YecE (DUF72 family)
LAEFLDFLPHTHRYAIEFRHPSWYNERTANLLSAHQICWVSSDFPNIPRQVTPTASFLYIRWVGINNTYHIHSYERVDKSVDLRWWLNLITPYLRQVPIVYGFFNNDYAGFAAGTCKRFMQIAGLGVVDDNLISQERLF